MRNSLKNLICNAMATDVMFALAGGPILIGYALFFGAGPIVIGILGSIEFIGNLFYFISTYLIQNGKDVKKISVLFSSISRPFYLVLALLAFCPKNNMTLFIFVISVFAAYGLSAISGGIFYPWMKVLLPKRIMTSFFAERCRWMMVGNIFALGFSAILIFLFKQLFLEQLIYAYAILTALAFIFGTISVLTLNEVKSAKVEIDTAISFSKSILLVFKNKSFLLFCLFMGMINFSTSFIAPFLTIFMLKQNKIEMPLVIFLTIVSNFVYVYSTQFWKKYAQNKGCFKMLNMGCVLYVIVILLFSLTINLPIISLVLVLLVGHFLLGYAKFAIKLGTNNLPLFYVPNKNSSIYLSFVSVFRAISSLISGIIAGVILLNLQKGITDEALSWIVFFTLSICPFLIAVYFSKCVRKEKLC